MSLSRPHGNRAGGAGTPAPKANPKERGMTMNYLRKHAATLLFLTAVAAGPLIALGIHFWRVDCSPP